MKNEKVITEAKRIGFECDKLRHHGSSWIAVGQTVQFTENHSRRYAL